MQTAGGSAAFYDCIRSRVPVSQTVLLVVAAACAARAAAVRGDAGLTLATVTFIRLQTSNFRCR